MKLIEFKMPKGFTLPEGTQAGNQFDEMATFRVKPNGDLCLVAVGDHKLPGYKTGEEMPEAQPMKEMGDKAAGRYQQMMGGGGY